MKDLYPRIQIVPMASCIAHEGVVRRWVDQIAHSILDHGMMKNPVIVARAPKTTNGSKWVVIDGMHRFAACQKLELRDILVCEIDYFSDNIRVEGWDAFTFKPMKVKDLLPELFPKGKGYSIIRATEAYNLHDRVARRDILLAACDKGENYLAVQKAGLSGMALLEELIHVTESFDLAIDHNRLRPLYVANSTSLADFENSDARSMAIRPHFTKTEILERTLANKLFPRKSTRHLIPDRPLRIDLNMSVLRADIDLKAKNRLLDEHLRWCYESDRVRYYPESIYIFSD
jgi:hypothetical protein